MCSVPAISPWQAAHLSETSGHVVFGNVYSVTLTFSVASVYYMSSISKEYQNIHLYLSTRFFASCKCSMTCQQLEFIPWNASDSCFLIWEYTHKYFIFPAHNLRKVYVEDVSWFTVDRNSAEKKEILYFLFAQICWLISSPIYFMTHI